MNLYQPYQRYQSIALVLSNGVSDFRMTLAARGLEAAGYHVEVLQAVDYWRLNVHDLFIVCRPGMQMLSLINAAVAIGKPVIVDMDDDFYAIPRSNPAYPFIGAGCENGKYHKALREVIENPKVLLSYASPELANRYNRKGFILLNPWDDQNPRWQAGNQYRRGVTVGWAGTNTHLEDFRLVLPALRQVMAEDEAVKVMIGGDKTIYDMFSDLPEKRKLFIPGMPYDTYPVMVQACDVWLAPLVDNHFNRAKSDIKLVDAVAARVPWLASPLPQYNDWACTGSGSIVKDGDWYDALKVATRDVNYRFVAGQQGEGVRMQRSSTVYGKQWADVVREALP